MPLSLEVNIREVTIRHLFFQQYAIDTISLQVFPTPTSNTPVDLTGGALFAEVRKKPGSPVILDLNPTFDDPGDGSIELSIDIGNTLAFNYQYDVFLELSSTQKYFLLRGNFRVDPSITIPS